MKNNTKVNILARFALFGAAFIWGSSFFIMKNTVDVLPTYFLLAIRFTLACIFLALIFYKRLKVINKQYIISGLIIGTCLFLAYYTQTLGITETSPGKNAFLTATYCIIVPFLFWVTNRTRPDKSNFFAAFLCLMGIGLVSLTEGLHIGFGDFFTLIGGFFFAAHMVAVALFAKDKDPIVITIIQFGFCAVFSWILGISFETFPSVSLWTPDLLLGMFYLVFFATAIALLLQTIGQKYTNPSTASIILSLESVFGVVCSMIFYGEKLTGKLTLGFLFIFLAVIISETKLSFLKPIFTCKKIKI